MRKIILISLLFVTNFIVKADLLGQTVPPCPAKMQGMAQNIDFKEYKGKVVLIDFWATWCPPCKQSMPFLNTLRNELLPQGFEIVAINVDEDKEQALRFLQTYPVDYEVAYDGTGGCPQKFDVQAMPSSYFVDRNGHVRSIHLGYRDSDQKHIKDQITKLLSEK